MALVLTCILHNLLQKKLTHYARFTRWFRFGAYYELLGYQSGIVLTMRELFCTLAYLEERRLLQVWCVISGSVQPLVGLA